MVPRTTSHLTRFDWDKLSPVQFEIFVYHLVAAIGYDNPIHVSGSGDRGRDVVAYLPNFVPGVAPQAREFVFQAKCVQRIDSSEIGAEVHKLVDVRIDSWVLVTTASPSPEVRRFVTRIDESGNYRFRIQAWWRDELDNLTRENASKLHSRLPTEISALIGLDLVREKVHGSTLAEASARCRDIANTQIERYAGGKYIPKLYIRRALQDRINDFMRPESLLAAEAKAQAAHGVEQVRNVAAEQISMVSKAVTNYTARADTANAKIRKLARRSKSSKAEAMEVGDELEETKAARDRYRSAANVRRRILKNSEIWRTRLFHLLSEASDAINQLSDSTFFGKSEEYRDAVSKLNEVREWLVSMPRTSFLQTEKDTGRLDLRRVEFGILDIEASTFNFGDHLHSIQNCLEHLHKHALLILDRAGSGKTNLICHIVEEYSTSRPVVLIFGKQNINGQNSLIEQVIDTLQNAFRDERSHVMENLDDILTRADSFLPVFIDGINENRRLPEYDAALSALIEWASHHRIQIVLTCRDIYWEFFDRDNWTFYLQSAIREELREFSPEEYEYALPQYLSHYGIDCELLGNADVTCHHPLIMRFFCEAYGSPGGPPVKLGAVTDIRLRELFEVYFFKKADEIRGALTLRSTAEVEAFLIRLAGKMYHKATPVLLLSEIPDATGEGDISSETSLYVRLLDEDIILEEQPADSLSDRRVTFVYEEFMEFLLARAMITFPSTFGLKTRADIFTALEVRKNEWVNTRGIGEYIAQMLLTSRLAEHNSDGMELLKKMATGDRTWQSAFWAVIPKLQDTALNPGIFDVIAAALERHVHINHIRNCLAAISRYNRDLADKLGGVILWSLAVPQILTWRQLLRLHTMSGNEIALLATELARRLSNQEWNAAPVRQLQQANRVIDAVSPFFTPRAKKSLKEARWEFGGPLLRFIVIAFPEHQLRLINGLFEPARNIRDLSAEGLRYVDTARPLLALIAKSLANVEGNEETLELLLRASQSL